MASLPIGESEGEDDFVLAWAEGRCAPQEKQALPGPGIES
jgi:hypothetical protein